MRRILAVLVLLASVACLTACAEHNGPMEKAGRSVDKAMNKTAKAVGKALEKTGSAIERGGHKIQKKVDEKGGK